MGTHQLLALRPDSFTLRLTGAVPRSHTIQLQVPLVIVPARQRILNTRVRHHAHVESNFIPPTSAACALAIAWFGDRGGCWLDHRVCAQERDPARDDEVEAANVACRRSGAKREVRQFEKENGGRGGQSYGRAD